MDALTHAIRDEIDTEELSALSSQCPDFHRAAINWADYSLRTYRGETLAKALDISRAIADFTAYLDSLE